MKNIKPVLLLIVLFSAVLQSCEMVEGIFKAGFYAGIFVVFLLVGIVIWLFSKFK